MQKLTLAIITFVLLTNLAFCDICEMDGVDWRRMTEDEQTMYVETYIDATLIFIQMLLEEPLSQAQKNMLWQHRFFWRSAEDIKDRIERYYMNDDNIETPLCLAPYMIWGDDE